MSYLKHSLLLPALLSLFLPVLSGTGLALQPASHFSDSMVLQRDAVAPIWGTAAPGAEVSIQLGDAKVSGKADTDGNWRIAFKGLKASSENRDLTILSGDSKKIIKNVLVGDVWLGSGQSNMAGKISSYAKKDPTLAALVTKAPYQTIRLMHGGPKPTWKPTADAATVNGFSAIHFAFGERLHAELDVPIGLIVGAVGGTPSGSWLPKESFEQSAACKADIAQFAKGWDSQNATKSYEAKLAVWEKRAAESKAKGEKVKGRAPKPPVQPGESTRGGHVGNLFERYIRSSVGYGIRGVLWDQGEAGSGILGLDQHTSMSALINGWRTLWGQGDFPFLFVQKPSGMGNAFSKENPITREANDFKPLPDISKAGNGQGRFLYTRLMQDNVNAWMVPAIDLGSSIHPINKWGYGNRVAEVALQMTYKKPGVQAYGPIYHTHHVSGNSMTVTFTQTAGGLAVAHSDTLQGFALAGEDGVWHWANTTLVAGDTVRVSAEAVPQPKHVRFAFSQDRAWANLFNKAGLPALAFTTEEER